MQRKNINVSCSWVVNTNETSSTEWITVKWMDDTANNNTVTRRVPIRVFDYR